MISFKHCVLFISLTYATIAIHPWSYTDETGYSCNLADQVLDFVVLADASCPMPKSLCIDQQLEIANTIAAIRGIQQKTINGQQYPAVRIGLIEFGSVGTTPNVVIDLLTDTVNNANAMSSAQSQQEIYQRIKNSSICSANTTSPHRYGQANLDGAIEQAVQQFDDQNNIRDKKVIIFSNCPVGVAEQQSICDKYGNVLRGGLSGDDEGHNVIMINNRIQTDWIELPQIQLDVNTYIDCLVSYDLNRIFVSNLWELSFFPTNTLPGLSAEICEVPTPAPTTDPTMQPTNNPSKQPTESPTASPTDETSPPTTPEPSSSPSVTPSSSPTTDPSTIPSNVPTSDPTTSTTTTSTTTTSPPTATTSTTSTTSTSSTTTTSTTSSGLCNSHRREQDCNAQDGCQWSNELCYKLIVESEPSTTSTSTSTTTESSTLSPETTTNTLIASTLPTATSIGAASNGTLSGPVSPPNSSPEPSIWVYVAIASGILCCCGLVAGLAVFCRKASKDEGYGYVATDAGGAYLSENEASRSINNQAVPAYRDEEAAAPANDDELQGLAQNSKDY